MKRVATALVLIPVFVWVILFAPEVVFFTAILAVGVLSYREFDQIVSANGITGALWPGVLAGLVLFFATEPLILAVLLVIFGMTLAMRVNDLRGAMASAGALVLGVIYIFGAMRCVGALHAINRHWLMFALLLSWAGDTAALYIGKALGKHKLAPRVSPGKTWEGAAGSVAGALLVGGVYAHYLIPSASIWFALLLAGVGNVAGQLGDLCESALKRGAGVKDSGSFLPGHGGWLDRIDSSLFGIPVVYALLTWLPKFT